MATDPRETFDAAPMSALQITVVAICVLLNALDGFDVLAISFAAPGIAAEWDVNRAALGIVLSMELIGMAAGSVLLGGIADRLGRRPTILGCLVTMTAGMYAASLANDVYTLSAIRLATGIGIGGMLASINAMAAEYSNGHNRSSAVALIAAGYPLGVVICGPIAALLLSHYDWRAVFVFGAVLSGLCIPLVLLLLPESISFLLVRRPAGALARVNRTLVRCRHQPIPELPPQPVLARTGWAGLFAPSMIRTTLLLTLAYLAHIMTFYFIIKWIPKIVVDMGFDASSAGTVLVWSSVGGASGAILFSLLTRRIGARALTTLTMLAAFVAVVVFGHSNSNLTELAIIAAFAGFFTNAGVVGLYAILAQSFPTELRAGGTGFVIGIGRGGAIVSPVIAGFLFEWGQGLPAVALWMGAGSLVGALALMVVRYRESGVIPASAG